MDRFSLRVDRKTSKAKRMKDTDDALAIWVASMVGLVVLIAFCAAMQWMGIW
jgi:hypothetical protein